MDGQLAVPSGRNLPQSLFPSGAVVPPYHCAAHICLETMVQVCNVILFLRDNLKDNIYKFILFFQDNSSNFQAFY